MDVLVEKLSSFTEHPLECQPVGAGTVAEVEAGGEEGGKDLGGGDIGGRVDVLDGVDHLGGGEEVGGFGGGGSGTVGGLQGSDVNADVRGGLLGSGLLITHSRICLMFHDVRLRLTGRPRRETCRSPCAGSAGCRGRSGPLRA